MKLIVDTNAYWAANRGDKRLKPWFSSKHELVFPLIVLGELRAGFALGNQEVANIRQLNRFLDASTVSVARLTITTAILYADIFKQLRQSGKAVGFNDIWIAAMAIEQNLPLLTLDADFQAIKGLQLVPV